MFGVSHVKGMKHNLLSIGKLIQKGYRVYMEDNHYVIKDITPRNQLIAKVSMTSNLLFPLRIVPYNIRVSLKDKTKESVVNYDNKENYCTEIQAVFQTKVQDDS